MLMRLETRAGCGKHVWKTVTRLAPRSQGHEVTQSGLASASHVTAFLSFESILDYFYKRWLIFLCMSGFFPEHMSVH